LGLLGHGEIGAVEIEVGLLSDGCGHTHCNYKQQDNKKVRFSGRPLRNHDISLCCCRFLTNVKQKP